MGLGCPRGAGLAVAAPCSLTQTPVETGSRCAGGVLVSEAHTALPTQVELLVMKALSVGLVKGSIDEVDRRVHMTWVQPRVLDLQQVTWRSASCPWASGQVCVLSLLRMGAPQEAGVSGDVLESELGLWGLRLFQRTLSAPVPA